jgi:hypothetical protein
MPQNDAVSKALDSAKGSLAHANAAFPSAKTPAAKPAVAAPAKKVPTTADELAAKSANVKQYTDSLSGSMTALPKMHEGGPVVSDGGYDLKAGEHVLTESQAKMARKHALMSIGMKRLSKPSPLSSQPEPAEKSAKSSPKKPAKGARK